MDTTLKNTFFFNEKGVFWAGKVGTSPSDCSHWIPCIILCDFKKKITQFGHPSTKLWHFKVFGIYKIFNNKFNIYRINNKSNIVPN